ncbi:hypothetical protein HZ993_21190 [Rhodoferax sp. AJA081-3]|uniref:GSU2403 family nucleotidyltransferase fold protein n=1 Tax=Rhodoferax sp. AJA081-3 TaxID=2752316 RepID=UPI001ADF9C6D|nr:GSU2403 family nucleotidyltransferase fold protein [Rhodoferax sp. AJA081-3]QTN27745.1 hypothetical protein HZ993_21190 [Rhodoferax sp. AJA081-3]
MPPILELLPNQTRQYIDAETVFLELQRARAEAAEVRGSMFWRTQGGAEYLIRESSGGAQKSLGPRSVDTQAIYDRFKQRKSEASSRLAALTTAAHNQQRLNKALRVGRVPGIVVKTLNALEAAGLQDHFMTIGTHALYAYESACGVRFVPDALATQDLDLLFDTRKRMSFVSHMRRMDSSFIGALQKADPSFRVMRDQKQTAINDAGFEVDVIRRLAKDQDPHPFRMSDDEDDLWAVQVAGAEKMLSAPRFSQVVVAETGHMAVMNTMNPVTFVAIKRMVSAAANRDPKKRLKDALQADLVESLIKTHMPQFAE